MNLAHKLAATGLLVGGVACGPAVSARPAVAEARPSTVGGAAVAPRREPDRAECTSDDGPPPDCGTLSGEACLGASLARRACETIAPLLGSRSAARWLECLRQPGSSGSACDSARIVGCGLRAADASCVDGSFRDLCTTLASDCADVAPEITAPVCEHLLGAFRPEHRSKLIDCLHHGCNTGGFGICLP